MTTYEAVCLALEQEKQDLNNARRRHQVAIEQQRNTGTTAKQVVKALVRYDTRLAEKERLECLT